MVFYGISDIGQKRKENQDRFAIETLGEDVLLCTVCDGMGGAAGGSTASHLALQTFRRTVLETLQVATDLETGAIDWKRVPMTLRETLEQAASEANRQVYRRASEDSSLSGMGTTLVAALLHDSTLTIASIGDSRIYLLTDQHLIQLSHDHSYVQYLIDIGKITTEEAASHPYRNIITRAIGSAPTVETDTSTVSLGDHSAYILLCTDGLTNFVPVEQIRKILLTPNENKTSEESLCTKVQALIDAANAGGGGDNITAAVLHYIAPDSSQPEKERNYGCI